jgi:hypothetical protein
MPDRKGAPRPMKMSAIASPSRYDLADLAVRIVHDRIYLPHHVPSGPGADNVSFALIFF